MRLLPWKPSPAPPPTNGRHERRDAGGGFTDAVVAAIEAQSAQKVADVSSTAAIESVAGLLSRAFAGATVQAEPWAQQAINPPWLAQVGRSLVREGASLSVIGVNDGRLDLTPAAFWNFETLETPGAELERDWSARVTTYGPSSSHTRLLPRDGLVFVRWGTSPGTRYRGQGPTSWANLTARLQGEAERSLADESAGPIAQLLAIPADGGDDGDDDPLKLLKADIREARGKAIMVETTAAGWGEGSASAPRRDWQAQRLGANPPESLVNVAKDSFARMVAACGASVPLFDDSDGTAKREALRQWHLGTVQPLAKVLAHELTMQLETDVRLKFDGYPLDIAGRAQAFAKLVAGGMSLEQAAAVTGILSSDD